LETNRIIKNFIVLLTILILTACSQGDDKMKIISYGTPEFSAFVKKSKISLDKAWELQLDFKKENIGNDFTYNIYRSNVLLFFIVDDSYVFTMSHVNNKMLEGLFLSGVWVDSETGKVSEIELEKFVNIKSTAGWRKK